MLETTYGTSVVFPCTDSRQSVTSLLELCQSHTACSSIILTLGRTVHAAPSCHGAAAAGQFLQFAGKGNNFLFILPHNLEAQKDPKVFNRNEHKGFEKILTNHTSIMCDHFFIITILYSVIQSKALRKKKLTQFKND